MNRQSGALAAIVAVAMFGGGCGGGSPARGAALPPPLSEQEQLAADGIMHNLRALQIVPEATPNGVVACSAARITKAFGITQARIVARDDDFEFDEKDAAKIYESMSKCADMRRLTVAELMAGKPISQHSKDCLAAAIDKSEMRAGYLAFLQDSTKRVVKSVVVLGPMEDAYNGCLSLTELDLVLGRT